MLQIPEVPRAVTSDADDTAKRLTGRRLARLVRKSTKTADRVLLALRLEQEGLHCPTRKQVAQLARVSPSYICTAARLSPEERAALGRGSFSLSSIHNHRRDADAEVARIIAKFGADVIMDALDRMTAPPINGNATTNVMAAE